MNLYLHDSPALFRFVLRGEITEEAAQQLHWAWQTAKSILNGKEVAVEVSGVTQVVTAGLELLSRMRESGARIIAARPPESQELLRFLDLPAAPRSAGGMRSWALRILSAARIPA